MSVYVLPLNYPNATTFKKKQHRIRYCIACTIIAPKGAVVTPFLNTHEVL